ncbi:type II CAAX prenyl endopeptidase Rce1 family protein [Rickettsia endosymbiont of Ixodes pacificus]|uniref:CPBP family glutamic-type intramembrane protease n=1 Tax=Rickettsia endosymbiont of Ixodes pacificus TaxID=1133329 RepID=UPI0005F87DE9|nr:CPBP family glutamic-type intramembrane protease [Rickettsia endosymbiont of Ixodes pacificus]
MYNNYYGSIFNKRLRKIPSILPIWAINNFFLVCMAEEVFFQGFLQNITKSFTETANFSCYYSIFNIWGQHNFQGGLIYIALSTICGFFYGYAYYKQAMLYDSPFWSKSIPFIVIYLSCS